MFTWTRVFLLDAVGPFFRNERPEDRGDTLAYCSFYAVFVHTKAAEAFAPRNF